MRYFKVLFDNREDYGCFTKEHNNRMLFILRNMEDVDIFASIPFGENVLLIDARATDEAYEAIRALVENDMIDFEEA